ncbi:MAG: anthranilate synthase component I [Phycisphaerales bacterium]|nr:anthranilate synthase component I [Phycisphaerales bacterium]
MIERVPRGLPPVHRRVLTRAVPLTVFQRLYPNEPHAFLYESLEAHGAAGRYSFLGARPFAVLKSKRDSITIDVGAMTQRSTGDPIAALRDMLAVYNDAPPIATFPGGAVGYFGYDVVRCFESVPRDKPDDLNHPDVYFMFPGEILVIDHPHEVVHILLYGCDRPHDRIAEIVRALADCEPGNDDPRGPVDEPPAADVPFQSNMTESEFIRAVARAKDYILAGDVFQVVLSQRFHFDLPVPPLDLYRALRVTNPSPYMYYLNLDGLNVLGSSPEMLVKLNGRRVTTRPLAGTRPRGATPELDRALADELRADHKERAEHIMLVDLARNDIGRVCRPGSIAVTDMLQIERYSRVMHLVSNVEGMLRTDRDAFDLLAATFPAGTVSGAPKIRAMEIIAELEPVARGIYAGAIGYISFLGDMDLCIAIRTMVLDGRRGCIQAGAGIVADSIPEREYAETFNKARALMRAVQYARADARSRM